MTAEYLHSKCSVRTAASLWGYTVCVSIWMLGWQCDVCVLSVCSLFVCVCVFGWGSESYGLSSLFPIQWGSMAHCSLTQKWTTLIRSTALDESAESSHCGNEGRVGDPLNNDLMICLLCVLSVFLFHFLQNVKEVKLLQMACISFSFC